MVQKVKKRFIKPKVLAFLGFLVVSFIIWLMITLSGSYVSTIKIQLVYDNVPEERLLLGEPEAFLESSVNASGYRLLNARLFRESLFLDVASFLEGGNRYYLTRTELQNAVKDQLEGLEVRRVYKDTLWLTLGQNKFKKVRVVPDLTVNFQEDHEYSEPLKITPDSVEIKGPEDMINRIDSVFTGKVVLRNLKTDFEREVRILLPDSLKKVELREQTVLLEGKVARYSEKLLEVPVVVENIPEGITVKTFPASVRLLCKADIEDLKRLVPSGFKVVCDYNEVQNNASYMLPRVVEKPSFVKTVTLLDTKVEFLLKRS